MRHIKILCVVACACFTLFGLSQDAENKVDPETKVGQEKVTTDNGQENVTVDEIISEVLSYEPRVDDEGALRDPFKSPFELEEERRRQEEEQYKDRDDDEERLEYFIPNLTLRGIYLEPSVGYMALFEVEDNMTKWYLIGTKFADGDLVNITDNSVHFGQFDPESEDEQREYIIELHRDEN